MYGLQRARAGVTTHAGWPSKRPFCVILIYALPRVTKACEPHLCAGGFHVGPHSIRFFQSHQHVVLFGKPWNFMHPASQCICCSILAHSMSPHQSSDYAYARALKGEQAWLAYREEKRKRSPCTVAMSKAVPSCFAECLGHVFNLPRRENDPKESWLGLRLSMKADDSFLVTNGR